MSVAKRQNNTYYNNSEAVAGTRSDGDEQSDFKTTTLRFTNNNFVVDGGNYANKFNNDKGYSPN